jgi:hypothetical protein
MSWTARTAEGSGTTKRRRVSPTHLTRTYDAVWRGRPVGRKSLIVKW